MKIAIDKQAYLGLATLARDGYFDDTGTRIGDDTVLIEITDDVFSRLNQIAEENSLEIGTYGQYDEYSEPVKHIIRTARKRHSKG